jgi:hypothetical protein
MNISPHTANINNLSMEALVTQLVKKDRKVCEEVYDYYSGALYNIILRIVKSEHLA